MPMLTNGSLFTGIGGLDLGAELVGIKTKWMCEIEPDNQIRLRKNFKNTLIYEDIRTIQNPVQVDIISGGFPCQDISIANTKAVGIVGSRSGLWSEMYRIIRQVRPKYVLIENSAMLLIRGFEQVLCDLSEIGYDAEWQCLSAKAFGLPHKRERLFIIAYPHGIGQQTVFDEKSIFSQTLHGASRREFSRTIGRALWKEDNTGILRIDDVLSDRMDANRLFGIGNAVTPVISLYLYRCILEHYKISIKNKQLQRLEY